MEIKIVLAKLLREYDWRVSPSYSGISSASYPPRLENKFKAVFQLLNGDARRDGKANRPG
jgi:hypothetical protein